MAVYNVDDYGAVKGPYSVAEWLIGGLYDQGFADFSAIQAAHPRATSIDITIDQVAFEEAIVAATVALDPNPEIVWGTGTYWWHRHVSWTAITHSSSWKFRGQGIGQTILTRVGGLLDPLLSGSAGLMIFLRPTGAGVKADIELYDVEHFGNSENNPLPDPEGNPYQYDQSAFFKCSVFSGGKIGSMIVHDVLLDDCIADGIQAAANSYTSTDHDLLKVYRVTEVNRIRTRAGIQWLQAIKRVEVDDCDLIALECEMIGNSSTQQYVRIRNTFTRILDLGGATNVTAGNENTSIFCDVENVVCNSFYYGYAGGEFRDCYLGVMRSGIRNPCPTVFRRCKVFASLDENGADNIVQRLGSSRENEARYSAVTWEDCEFGAARALQSPFPIVLNEIEVVTTPVTGHLYGSGLIGSGLSAQQDNRTDRLIRCKFANNAQYGILVGRNGWIETEGCEIGGMVAGVYLTHGSTDRYAGWHSKDDSFDAPYAYEVGPHDATAAGNTDVRIANGNWSKNWTVFVSNETNRSRFVWDLSRTMHSDSADNSWDPDPGELVVLSTPRTQSVWKLVDRSTGEWALA